MWTEGAGAGCVVEFEVWHDEERGLRVGEEVGGEF